MVVIIYNTYQNIQQQKTLSIDQLTRIHLVVRNLE
jgi:hypothetical protein